MKKATKWFLLTGMICMSFNVFTRVFFKPLNPLQTF